MDHARRADDLAGGAWFQITQQERLQETELFCTISLMKTGPSQVGRNRTNSKARFRRRQATSRPTIEKTSLSLFKPNGEPGRLVSWWERVFGLARAVSARGIEPTFPLWDTSTARTFNQGLAWMFLRPCDPHDDNQWMPWQLAKAHLGVTSPGGTHGCRMRNRSQMAG
jgi:hypothetical protein